MVFNAVLNGCTVNISTIENHSYVSATRPMRKFGATTLCGPTLKYSYNRYLQRYKHISYMYVFGNKCRLIKKII